MVQFHGHEMRGAGGQRRGDCPAAGTDLDDRALPDVADRVRDAFDGARIDEEVLAELGFGGPLF
jgi:hypothetical protein